MDVVCKMTWNRNSTLLYGVLVATVTTARCDAKPSIVFDHADNVPDLHSIQTLPANTATGRFAVQRIRKSLITNEWGGL
jgi:hypothetical protein